MLKQEAATLGLVKSEPQDVDLGVRPMSPDVVMATSTSEPELMDQDPPTIVTIPQAQNTQLPLVPQAFSSRTVSIAPLQSPGPVSQSLATQPTGTAQAVMVQPRPIVPQGNKVAVTPSVSGSKPVYISASSPNKFIRIPSGNVHRLVPGIGNIPRLQIVPAQPRVTPQTTLRPIAPRLATSTTSPARPQVAQIQIKPVNPRAGKQVPQNSNQQAPGVVQQRVVLQAHPGSTQLRAIAPNLGNLPPGATIQFPPGTIIKDGVVYVPQQVQAGASTSGVQLPAVQIAPAVSSTVQPVNGVQEPPSPTRQRKPCNCTKSQCLKLYCDCFANGEFCSNCNCNNCFNNIEHEQDRSKAIKACLERNPHAFHPKIGKGKGETERRHNKGCHCKRSGCLKNYCECYEAKILCTNICKCTGCKNFEESPERKTLMHLADAAEVRVQQQNAAKTKLESQMEDLPSRAPILAHAGEKLPFSFVTQDVVEATCRCLLVQASAAEKKNISPTNIQKLVLEEFGNCLLKIIHSANSRSAN